VRKLVRIIGLIVLVFLLGCSSSLEQANVQDSTITVYYNGEVGQVNKRIFGNNFIGYDPTTYEDWTEEYYGYSDFGAGVWDPGRKESVKDVIGLAQEAGVTIVRFPGGCGTHHYNWKAAVGKKRTHFLYGIDEFLKTCSEIKAEPVMTVSYFTGDDQDAADLVEYLNSPNDKNNPDGGMDWAAQRVENGHLLPYKVNFFEIGNEVWHGDHQKIKEVLPEEYAKRYLKYYEKMKAVDPSIKIGCILHTQDWNRRVLEIIKEKIDFGIIHTYPSPSVSDNKLAKMSADAIFKMTLSSPIVFDEYFFQEVLKLLKEMSGRDVPLSITEYNGGFVQSNPVPYRHCLGTALLNAEMLRIFMKPEHNILMANYWNFVNEYWGMIKSETSFIKHDYRKPIHYIKRPNYYVYELYNKHFGDVLLSADVNCGSYAIGKNVYKTAKSLIKRFIVKDVKRDVRSIPYLSVNASKNKNGSEIYLMVINKNMDESIASTIDFKDFVPAQKGNAWILNGPSVDATNEKTPSDVRVKYVEFEVEKNGFTYTFEPHSLTAISIGKHRH